MGWGGGGRAGAPVKLKLVKLKLVKNITIVNSRKCDVSK
jgi:hypothetical protein